MQKKFTRSSNTKIFSKRILSRYNIICWRLVLVWFYGRITPLPYLRMKKKKNLGEKCQTFNATYYLLPPLSPAIILILKEFKNNGRNKLEIIFYHLEDNYHFFQKCLQKLLATKRCVRLLISKYDRKNKLGIFSYLNKKKLFLLWKLKSLIMRVWPKIFLPRGCLKGKYFNLMLQWTENNSIFWAL